MTEPLVVKLLGGLTITHAGRLLTDFKSRKAEAILVYLLSRPEPVARADLAAVFWDDSEPSQANANLRKTLSDLRQNVGDWLLIDKQAVAFDRAQPYSLDVADFEAALADLADRQESLLTPAEAATLAAALSHYYGPFLAGFYIGGARTFSDWADAQRYHLAALATAALRRLVTFYLHWGEYKAGVAAAKQLLALEPLDEAAHRLLLRLLARAGQFSAALAEHESFRRQLAEEMGVAPEPATAAVHTALLAAQARAAQTTGRLTDFVGRRAELATLSWQLDQPDDRLLTIVGLGGVGKTRLAQQLVAVSAADFDDGAIFVPLAATTDAFVVASINAALGLPTEGRQKPRQQLLEHLRSRHLLLVLDNFEHLLAVKGLLPEILRAAPRVRLVVTSRQPLDLPEEWLLQLGGLPYPGQNGAQRSSILDYEALRLFQARAARVRPGFQITAENQDDVIHICQLVSGLPLGLELAAATTRAFPPAHIAAQLQQNLDFLSTRLRDLPPRQRSMRAVFEYTWGLLPAAEQEALAQLAVFRGPFDKAAAQAVLRAAPALLAGWVGLSLLYRPAPGQYAMHALLRVYLAGKLVLLPERAETAHERHSAYFADLLQLKAAELTGDQAISAMAAITQAIDNVRAVWQRAVSNGDVDLLARCHTGLYRFYLHRGPFAEGIQQLQAALDRLAPAADGAAEAELVAELRASQADLLVQQSYYEDAIRVGEQVVETGRSRANTRLEATGLLHMGRGLTSLGKYDEAQVVLEQARSLVDGVKLRRLAGTVHLATGILSYSRGEYEQAGSEFANARDIFAALGDRWRESEALNDMGVIARNTGDFNAAREYYQQARQAFERLGDRLGQSRALNNLGVIARSLGDYTAARFYYEACLQLKRAIGDRRGESLALNNLANILSEQGAFTQAEGCFQQALRLYREMGRRRDEAMVLSNLGLLAHLQARHEEALRWSQQALNLAAELGDPTTQAFALCHMGHAELALGEAAAAARDYELSLELRAANKEPHLVVESQAGLARAWLALGELDAARNQVESIERFLAESGVAGAQEPFRVYLSCYEVWRALGETARASTVLAHAHAALHERAGRIEDETLRRSYLHQVPVHRQLIQAYDQAE